MPYKHKQPKAKRKAEGKRLPLIRRHDFSAKDSREMVSFVFYSASYGCDDPRKAKLCKGQVCAKHTWLFAASGKLSRAHA